MIFYIECCSLFAYNMVVDLCTEEKALKVVQTICYVFAGYFSLNSIMMLFNRISVDIV